MKITACSMASIIKLNEIIEAMLHAVNVDRMWVIVYKLNEIIGHATCCKSW